LHKIDLVLIVIEIDLLNYFFLGRHTGFSFQSFALRSTPTLQKDFHYNPCRNTASDSEPYSSKIENYL
jgi:hypothetical protein